MDINKFEKVSETQWRVEPFGRMRVPAILFADENLVVDMDDKVFEQMTNVAMLPGIVKASYAMPDAHWGYGFPIGGVAAFDAEEGGVVSAGGVGFDISCGVRSHITGLTGDQVRSCQRELADALFEEIPVGVGSHEAISLSDPEMTDMLEGGAKWAVSMGWGMQEDLERIEEQGCAADARPQFVSANARKRQRREMGTLGSGNHYLEIQEIAEILDEETGAAFGLVKGQCLLTIHCGSRGLGHQIGSEFLREMAEKAPQLGIELPDRELACAPIVSELGQRYLGAMRAAINCALANREIIGHLARGIVARIFPGATLPLLFDVSHNTCKLEPHRINGQTKELYIHRKGATRAFGPGHPSLCEPLRAYGQPVLIGGSMGTGSYVLAGTQESEGLAFSSACHGAGRAMSRHKAGKLWKGRQVADDLHARGIIVRSPSSRGVAEEAPGAYKDVGAVVTAAERSGLARMVARLSPVICIKG
jgi:tRNA-splicing ligase RtcB